MANQYKQVTDERFKIITARYTKFQAAMNDSDLEVVPVFDPLSQKQIDELHLIREVSKDLQKKKEDDINKSAQAEAELKHELKEVEKVSEPGEKKDD